MLRTGFLLALCLFAAPSFAQPLKIGVSESMLALPFFMAESEGLFQKKGVEVELVNCFGGRQCIKNMLDGKTDLATAAEMPVVISSFTRSDFAILTSFGVAYNNVKIVVKSPRPFPDPSALKNLTIGYVKGGTSQYVLDLVLVYHGIDPNKTKLKPIASEALVQALVNKEVDAISIWEPVASRMVEDLKGEAHVVSTPKLYTETFNLVATHNAIKSRKQDIGAVIHVLKESTNLIAEQPDKAKALVVKRLGLPLDQVERIFEDYRFRLSLSRSLVRTMEGQARWAIREGHVDKNAAQPNFTNYLYPALLKSVDPDAVSFQ